MPEHFQSRLTLVIRQRATKCAKDGFNRDSDLYERAADEIERLEAEVARLWNLVEEYRQANTERASEIARSIR
jgi:hypothetical protein